MANQNKEESAEATGTKDDRLQEELGIRRSIVRHPWVSTLVGFVIGTIVSDIVHLLYRPAPAMWTFLWSHTKGPLDSPWSSVALLAIVGFLVWVVVNVFRDLEGAECRLSYVGAEVDSTINQLVHEIDEGVSYIQTMRRVGQLQWSLISAFDNLMFAEPLDRTQTCEAALKLLLADSARALEPLIFRSYVLRPNGDYLEPYVHFQMPAPDGYQRQFYIGDDPARINGVAGNCFKTGKLQIARATPDIDQRFDHPRYVRLSRPDDPPHYRAFICVPAFGSQNSVNGVLCLDSGDEEAFDDEELQAFIQGLGVLVGVLLDLAEKSEAAAGKERTVTLVWDP